MHCFIAALILRLASKSGISRLAVLEGRGPPFTPSASPFFQPLLIDASDFCWRIKLCWKFKQSTTYSMKYTRTHAYTTKKLIEIGVIHRERESKQSYSIFRTVNIDVMHTLLLGMRLQLIKLNLFHWEYRQRPYHVENTRSRLISEVKQHRAALVLAWVTGWESAVSLAFFCKILEHP